MCGKGCGYCCGCCDPRIKTCWSPCFWHSTVRWLNSSRTKRKNKIVCLQLFCVFFFQLYNIYNVMRSGRAVMPWPDIPWAWRSVSSPTLLTSCRFITKSSARPKSGLYQTRKNDLLKFFQGGDSSQFYLPLFETVDHQTINYSSANHKSCLLMITKR